MSGLEDKFFTVIGCMDGRIQEPIASFGKSKCNADYPDTITEAGLVGFLGNEDKSFLDSLTKKLLISLEKHHSKGIIVHGHQDCAGNQVDDAQHKEDVIKSAEIIRSMIPRDTQIIPVFVRQDNSRWIVEAL